MKIRNFLMDLCYLLGLDSAFALIEHILMLTLVERYEEGLCSTFWMGTFRNDSQDFNFPEHETLETILFSGHETLEMVVSQYETLLMLFCFTNFFYFTIFAA
ncbi:hypothetical protein C1646_674319 [Rhizophagus diaphanus]|nr:hypothetical protein C1646_674319 [Rhizophagus diaphanus] [Rhizophagus sp. MUCL 43196]